MPAMTVGFSEVEQQLQRLRRRLNLIEIQHAAYVIGTVAALGAAGSMVMAARGSPLPPGVGVWITLAGVALTTVLTVVFCRRRWMSLQTTARFADTRSHLDDRLATLYAHRHRGQPPSRLAGILLTQALALKPRWDVPAIAPRRFPRSIYALLTSLCALAFAWQLDSSLPPGAAPDKDSAPAIATQNRPSDSPHTPAEHAQRGMTGPQSDGANGGAGESDAGEEIETGAPKAGSGISSRDVNAPKRFARREDGKAGSGHAGVPDRLQHLNHDADEGEAPASQDHATPGTEATGGDRPRDANDSANGEHLPAKPPESKRSIESADNPKPRPGQQKGEQTASKAASGQPQPALSSGGSVAAQQTTGASSQGLLTDPQSQQRLNGELRKFALKLTAFSSAEPSQSEPQTRPKRGEVSDVGTPASNPAAPHLSELDVPDDPLHRTEIAPEHEAIVRSVFQRE